VLLVESVEQLLILLIFFCLTYKNIMMELYAKLDILLCYN